MSGPSRAGARGLAGAMLAGAMSVPMALGGPTPSWAGMRHASGPSPTEDATQAQVTVDASEVGTMPPRMVLDVAAKATLAMEDAGLPPSAARLTFVEIDPMTVLRGVRVSLVTDDVAVADEQGDPRGRLLASCTACSDAELAGLAIEAVLEAIDIHEDAVRARLEEAEAAAAPEVSAPSEPEPAAPPPDEPRARLGALGITGIAALSTGVGSVIAGGVLASRRPKPYPGEPRMDVLRDLRPSGYAMVGVGGALVVAGVVLLLVDRRGRGLPLALRPRTGPAPSGLVVTLPW